MDVFGQNLAFDSADSDADVTVTFSGVVWSRPLVFRGADVDLFFRIPDIDDKLYDTNYQVLALSFNIGGSNTLHLGGTWYLMSW